MWGLLGAALLGLRSGADSYFAYDGTVLKISVACLVGIVCMYYYDFYESQAFTSLREVATRLTQVLGTSCLILALLYYAYPTFQLTLGILLAGITPGGGLMAGGRKLFFVLSRTARFPQRVLL